ncbi:hypothetical protein [Blastopirellula marina]|uniref:O-antigen ligase domain-containing protein n=1 Tax=Blastopirellula marina TaxID=124 RepID=A0A2S8F9E0_9BACT|nr:hypothetical protein [Blastopirellula marina]PQO28767.1 hypothetical protein C5Y98_23590 [Blastopirellula marina]PTL42040.1 hypothetical protein C5Y97_23605 [Blastopirellula marina]
MNEPSQVFLVEGSGTTYVHPIGVALLIICGGLLLFLPRKYAVFPIAVIVCFVASRQCIAIGGLNLYFLRLMVLIFGSIRILVRGELLAIKLNALDWCVVFYGIISWLTAVLNFGPFSPDVKMRSGNLVEIIGLYFLLRAIIRDEEDVYMAIKTLAVLSVPLVLFFGIEYATGRNLFSIFGGVPEITAIRAGRLRCQGAFGHPLLAGTVWASFAPLFIYGAISRDSSSRFISAVAFVCTSMIVVLTASSTPVLGLAVAIFGMMLYPLRQFTRPAVVGMSVFIVVLHFVMEGPVWSLIAKINITKGNSGYHRYLVVDGFITHWYEWFLLGSRVGTAHWGHFTFDTANQYVATGVVGGIGTLMMFLGSIVFAFIAAGRVARYRPLLGWALGCVIAVHCVNFFGISIWGQLHFAWSLPLAMLASLQQSFASADAWARQREQFEYFHHEASLSR